MPDPALWFWFVQGPGWVLFAYLAVAQGLAAISYPLGVRMGTQEPEQRITAVGVAFFWGLAFADLVFYMPLLGIGLIGHAAGARWGGIVLGAALGVSVYWPIACLATVAKARGTTGWSLPKERQYWIVLPAIATWAAGSLVLLILG